MDAATIKRRVQAVRRQIAAKALDGLIVTGAENVRYLTGFGGHDSWVLVLPGKVILITDSRYTEQAAEECMGCRIAERKGPLPVKVAEILAGHPKVRTLGTEDSCSIMTLTRLRKTLPIRVKPTRHAVEALRAVKSDGEVTCIRKAAKIAFDAMDWALGQIRPGITERQLAALYVYRLSAYGAKEAFETIVAFGPNGSRNHHQPGSRKLAKNDVLLLDFGARYEGYNSDVTRCFAVGQPSDFYCRAYQAAAHAQKAAIAAVRPGAKVCTVDAAARQVIAAAGLPVFGHGTGHGLGLEVHEMPSVTGLDKTTRLEPGQVITIEPGVYLPGRFGIRLEEDLLVTESGCKVLTSDRRFDVDSSTVPVL